MVNNQTIEYCRQIRIQRLLGIPDLGRDYKIKCVFHSEKSPSLLIYGDKGYRCFGCGKSGQNAIDFVMGLGFSFEQAIKELSTV